MRCTTPMLALALFAAAGHADIIDFEGLAHGEVITNQFADLGVQISVINYNKAFHAGVIFNSNLSGTADPDLEAANRLGGNLQGSTGNLLIIQENDLGLESGFASDPDDEAGRPSGQITVQFSERINSFGFDVFDLDDLSLEMTSIEFYANETMVASYDFASFASFRNAIYGDSTANRIDPLSADEGQAFDRVVFNVGGSMAFDNFSFTTVPAPSTAMAVIGAAMCVTRRRRSA